MAGIAKNKCADFHRRDKRDTNRDIDFGSIINHAAFGGGVSIADDQHQTVVVKEIRNVISQMKPIYRDVGELHIQGHTLREISEKLEIPEGNRAVQASQVPAVDKRISADGYTPAEIADLTRLET